MVRPGLRHHWRHRDSVSGDPYIGCGSQHHLVRLQLVRKRMPGRGHRHGRDVVGGAWTVQRSFVHDRRHQHGGTKRPRVEPVCDAAHHACAHPRRFAVFRHKQPVRVCVSERQHCVGDGGGQYQHSQLGVMGERAGRDSVSWGQLMDPGNSCAIGGGHFHDHTRGTV